MWRHPLRTEPSAALENILVTMGRVKNRHNSNKRDKGNPESIKRNMKHSTHTLRKLLLQPGIQPMPPSFIFIKLVPCRILLTIMGSTLRLFIIQSIKCISFCVFRRHSHPAEASSINNSDRTFCANRITPLRLFQSRWGIIKKSSLRVQTILHKIIVTVFVALAKWVSVIQTKRGNTSWHHIRRHIFVWNTKEKNERNPTPLSNVAFKSRIGINVMENGSGV